MTILPNPFQSTVPQAVEAAVASPVHAPGTVDAAANHYGTGPALPAVKAATDSHRFVLDEQAFMEAIEPLPLFLQSPVRADELIGVLAVLAGH